MSGDRDEAPQDDGAPIEQSPYQQRLAEQAALDLDAPPPGSSWDVVRAKWDSLGSVQKLRAKQLGVAAAIVPLSLAAIPYYARIAEVSLREVDHGLIEAARARGGGTALPSIMLASRTFAGTR